MLPTSKLIIEDFGYTDKSNRKDGFNSLLTFFPFTPKVMTTKENKKIDLQNNLKNLTLINNKSSFE